MGIWLYKHCSNKYKMWEPEIVFTMTVPELEHGEPTWMIQFYNVGEQNHEFPPTF